MATLLRGGSVKHPETAALLTAVLLAVSACTTGSPDPAPTPTPQDMSNSFGFVPKAQYQASATLDQDHTQTISVTVGEPLTVGQHRAANRQLYCRELSTNDLLVPLFIEVQNTSLTTASPATLGASLHLAVDETALGDTVAVSVQDDDAQDCAPQGPLENATTTTIAGMPETQLSLWTPSANATTGQSIQGKLHIMFSAGAQERPQANALFLRLSPIPSLLGKAPYTITTVSGGKISSDSIEHGFAGVVTEGPDRGTFYVPIDPTVNPCTTFSKGVPMKCGSPLAAP